MKLPVKTKLGFASASLADGLSYVFFYSFFLLYLTDYAGVRASWAGTISMIVILWDAVTDPVLGYVSDHFRRGSGRRRPFILFGILPWGLSLILMFLNISLGEPGKFAYYLFMALIFWTSYTICLVPYNALGSELTDDYSETASLRLFAQVFSSAGTTLASSLTILLVTFFAGAFGCGESQAWLYVAILYALLSMLSLFITWRAMKGRDSKAPEKIEKKSIGRIFREYAKQLKEIRPLKWILLAIAFFMCGNSFYGSGIFYAYTYILGFSDTQIMACSLFCAVIGIGLPILLDSLVRKVDKKTILTLMLSLSTVSLFAFRLIGVDTSVKCYVYLFFYALSNAGFWGLFWSFVYDCCDVDRLANGTFRQGATTSIASMTQKFGSAIAMWLIGIVLSVNGYDGMAASQSAGALRGILDVITIWPGVFTLMALIFLRIYPVNAHSFRKVQKGLARKEAGEEYSTEGLDRIL